MFVFVDHLSFFKISTSNSMLDMVGPLQVIRGRCAFICMGNVQPMYLQEEEVKTYFCKSVQNKVLRSFDIFFVSVGREEGGGMNVFCKVFLKHLTQNSLL